MKKNKIPMLKGTKKLTQYNICGIYLLMHNGCVVYVGQSIDISARISKHIQENKKEFDEIRYLEYSKEELEIMEKYIIAHFSPKYNISHNNFASKYKDYLNDDIYNLTAKEYIECNNVKEVFRQQNKNMNKPITL